MKKNNKGFMLAEVFIVSSFVLGVLVYTFIQINSIMKNYNKSFSYDTVQGLYIANEIKNYLNYNSSNKEFVSSACENYKIFDVSDDYWSKIKKSANIKTVILGNLNYIKENVATDSNISAKQKDYIKYLGEKDSCILLLEYNDDTYVSLSMWWRAYEKE